MSDQPKGNDFAKGLPLPSENEELTFSPLFVGAGSVTYQRSTVTTVILPLSCSSQ